jgi:transposase InsO family protein
MTTLRQTFKYVGLPSVLVTDNGTNFASDEFSKFTTDNYIQHVFTPPGHHASNGQAERVVQEFKLHLCKFPLMSNSVEELDRATISFCLHHNTTPSANGAVPNSFVFIKSLRTRLTAQCTETVLTTQVPVYIRAENKLPVPGALIAKHGSNTNFSETGRLVHDADATPMVREDAVGVDDRDEEPASEAEETQSQPVSEDPSPVSDVRRSQRHRQAPERYGF